ncbi:MULTISPECIES: hypothetical protein [Streptomyces]|uniref:hypothetical protein n=2 Tax=Streptomyces TaxID=1883 RepID=UPI0033CD61EC
MIMVEIALAVLRIALQQAVHGEFGPLGVAGFCLLGIGLKARNSTCILVATILLVLLMTPS